MLPLQSQYIISLLLTVVNNKVQHKVNLDIYSISTRNKQTQPSLNLETQQEAIYYFHFKVFSNLPSHTKTFWMTPNNLNQH